MVTTSFRTSLLSLLPLVVSCGALSEAARSSEPVALTPFDSTYVSVGTITLDSAKANQIIRFSGFAVRPEDGHFYLADASEARVVHFDATGRAIRVLGGRGEGPGLFTEPRFLSVAADTLWVGGGRGRVSIFVRDTFRREFRVDSVTFLSSFSRMNDGTFSGGTLPPVKGAVLHWDSQGKFLARGVSMPDAPVKSGMSGPWRSVLQYWSVPDRQAGKGVIVLATISDSIWNWDPASGSVVAYSAKYAGYAPPKAPDEPNLSPRTMQNWTKTFDATSAPFSSRMVTGFSFVHGVLYYGDPHVLMIRDSSRVWRALNGGPPILGASADTLFGLMNPQVTDKPYVIGKYLPRNGMVPKISLNLSTVERACSARQDRRKLSPVVALVTSRTCLSCKGVGYVLRHATSSGDHTSVPLDIITEVTDTGEVCAFLRRERTQARVFATTINRLDAEHAEQVTLLVASSVGTYNEQARGDSPEQLLPVVDSLVSSRRARP